MKRLLASLICAAIWLAVPARGYAQDDPPETPNPNSYQVRISQVDTSNYPEINVYLSVTDAESNPVRTLDDNDFTVMENGEPATISEVYQAGETGPVAAVLTIDRSGSMLDLGKIDAAKQAALAFVDLMRAQDQTGVIAFNTQVTIVQPLTSDKAALREAINGIQAFNDTALYDALAASINMLQGVEGRKAIILLSDGLDNSSRQTLDQLMPTLNDSEISVFTVGLGNQAAGLGSMEAVNEAALQQIAEQSRGQYTYAPGPDALQSLYEQISMRLQNEYQITYTSPNTLRNGVVRDVEVLITPDAGAVASTSSGRSAGYNPGGLIPETEGTLSMPVFAGLLALGIVGLIVPDMLRRIREGRAPAEKPGRVKLTKPVPPTGKKVAPTDVPNAPPLRSKK